MNREKVLEKMITKYATSYYRGETEISDEAFDSLVDELRSINPNNELLRTPGWGYTPGKNKINHWYNLTIGSLDKLKDGIDVIPQKYQKDTTRVSAKLDGLSVVTYYINGVLIEAITRGDGHYGIDVTRKLRKILSKDYYSYNGKPFTGAIRGEIIMPMKVFKEKYDYINNPNLNPRNLAAGILNRDNDTDIDQLRYVPYKVLVSESHGFQDISQIEIFLKSNFDYVAPMYYRSDELAELRTAYEDWKAYYPCDGLVLSNYSGTSADVLEWDEIAYKFEAEIKEVEVKEVTWNPTRTGRLVPLVWFDPIDLTGAMVQKCTGFNAQFIKDNDVGVGARITVMRSGDVIPDLQAVITPVEPTLPDVCPTCGTPLRWSGVDLVCDAENESQLGFYFISSIAPLDGAGWSLYNSLTEKITSKDDLIKYIKDLKQIGAHRMVSTLGITGEVTTNKAIKVLEMMFNPIDPIVFITACNIPGIGESTATAILNAYPNFIEEFCSATFNLKDLLKINGIGESVINKLTLFHDRVKSLANIVTIKSYEVKEKADVQFKVAITGALSVKRADFDNKLKERGIVQSGNWNEIKYLITNNPDSGSSKMKMAKEKGIEIISEEEFTKMYLM